MSSGSKLLFAITISLLFGLGGGYLLFSEMNSVDSPVVSELPINEYAPSMLSDIGAEDCSEVLATSQVSCIEGLLLQKALETRDTSYCEQLSMKLSQTNCETRVNRLLALASFEAGSLCNDIESELCPDSVLFLTAEETGDAEQCLNMSNEEYKQFCLRLIASPEDQSELIASGNVCGLGDVLCEENNQILAQALSSNNPSACSASANEQFADFCRKELVVYQAYTAQDASICSSLTDPNENAGCVNTVRISSVLSGQELGCSIVDPEFAQDCQRAVSLGYYPRFALVDSQ